MADLRGGSRGPAVGGRAFGALSPMTDTVQARAQPRSVLITGASSGIGATLALAYAREECALRSSGRDEARRRAR